MAPKASKIPAAKFKSNLPQKKLVKRQGSSDLRAAAAAQASSSSASGSVTHTNNTLTSIDESGFQSKHENTSSPASPMKSSISTGYSSPSFDDQPVSPDKRNKRKSSIPKSESSKEMSLIPERASIVEDLVEEEPPKVPVVPTLHQLPIFTALPEFQIDFDDTFSQPESSNSQVASKKLSTPKKEVGSSSENNDVTSQTIDKQPPHVTNLVSTKAIDDHNSLVASTEASVIAGLEIPLPNTKVDGKAKVTDNVVPEEPETPVKEKHTSIKDWGGRKMDDSSDNYGQAARGKPNPGGRVSSMVAKFEKIGGSPSQKKSGPSTDEGSPSVEK